MVKSGEARRIEHEYKIWEHLQHNGYYKVNPKLLPASGPLRRFSMAKGARLPSRMPELDDVHRLLVILYVAAELVRSIVITVFAVLSLLLPDKMPPDHSSRWYPTPRHPPWQFPHLRYKGCIDRL